jgi:hypothetical protein
MPCQLTSGAPPVLHVCLQAAAAAAAAAASASGPTDPTKFVGKKSKAASKRGPGATQWEILMKSGIPEDEIPRFRCGAASSSRGFRTLCGVMWSLHHACDVVFTLNCYLAAN